VEYRLFKHRVLALKKLGDECIFVRDLGVGNNLVLHHFARREGLGGFCIRSCPCKLKSAAAPNAILLPLFTRKNAGILSDIPYISIPRCAAYEPVAVSQGLLFADGDGCKRMHRNIAPSPPYRYNAIADYASLFLSELEGLKHALRTTCTESPGVPFF
jgi:hypothetical protein